MYKIFFDDRLLRVQESGTPIPNADLVLNLDGSELPAVIGSILEAFRDNRKTECLCLRSADVAATFSAIRTLFTEINAAGGVVFNSSDELLMIHRNGKWDLPKGKLEPGESDREGAIREVEEECGITGLKIINELSPVYHTYRQNGKDYLKKTSWFKMSSDYEGELKPQAEEGITEVKWMNRRQMLVALENTYASIRDLLRSELIR